jgi:hypothetical protein
MKCRASLQGIKWLESTIPGLLEKYPTLFFAKTWCISINHACTRWPWTFLHMSELFSCLLLVSVDGKQHLSEVVFSALVGFYYRENLMQHYSIKFSQELGDSQVDIQMMLWTSHRLRSGIISLKMATNWWIVSRDLAGLQQVEMTRLLPKWMLWWCGTVVWLSEKLWKRWTSAHSILTEDLAVKRVTTKFMPKLLTAEQKQLRVEVSQDMLDSTNSPDIQAPFDFWLFPKLKRLLKGKWFQTRGDIMTATTVKLNTILKEAFSECF